MRKTPTLKIPVTIPDANPDPVPIKHKHGCADCKAIYHELCQRAFALDCFASVLERAPQRAVPAIRAQIAAAFAQS